VLTVLLLVAKLPQGSAQWYRVLTADTPGNTNLPFADLAKILVVFL
jgi:hypothetical protein